MMTEFIRFYFPLFFGLISAFCFLRLLFSKGRGGALAIIIGWVAFLVGVFIGGVPSRTFYPDIYGAIGDNPGQIADLGSAIFLGILLYPLLYLWLCKKRRRLWVIVNSLVVLALAVTWFSAGMGFRSSDHERQLVAKHVLKKLIIAEDFHFSKAGSYLSFRTDNSDSGSDARKLLNWCKWGCGPCDYAVNAADQSFTATTRCKMRDGSYNSYGYVRVSPGEHVGVKDFLEECDSSGIYTSSGKLVNTFGPCKQQKRNTTSVAPGSMRRLSLLTYPMNAEVRVNGKFLGITRDTDDWFYPGYGSLYWADPVAGKIEVEVAKDGYESQMFPLEWGSTTYTAVVVLTEKAKRSPSAARLVDGTAIICDREAYNCPSYKGVYQEKRLSSCEDVRRVWKACSTDVHGLDGDKKGKPCERDCGHD